MIESLAVFFCFSMYWGTNSMLKMMIASMIHKWEWTIIRALYLPLREIACSCTSEQSQIRPAVVWMKIRKNPGICQSLFVIPALDQQRSQVHQKSSPVLCHVPKLFKITPMVLLYHSSGIPVTPKAGRNVLLGSDSLLKLTLLSLHSTPSQTLLEAPCD